MALNPLQAALQGLALPLSPIMLAVQGLLDELLVAASLPSQDRGNPARAARKPRPMRRADPRRREDEELLVMLQAALAVL